MFHQRTTFYALLPIIMLMIGISLFKPTSHSQIPTTTESDRIIPYQDFDTSQITSPVEATIFVTKNITYALVADRLHLYNHHRPIPTSTIRNY